MSLLTNKKKDDNKRINLPLNNTIISNNNDTINEYDRYLVIEHLNKSELNIDFCYNSPQEIKNFLSQFFNGKFPNQTVTNFITSLIFNFSDMLFYSYLTLQEIKEIDIVKNALHERFKKYRKISNELQIEINDMQKLSKTNKDIKDILMKQRQEVEVKYNDTLTHISVLKDEINVI